jgi:DnaJ-class molecular chaperone
MLYTAICTACDGEGSIVFNPHPRLDPRCEDSAPCGECGGTGEVDIDHEYETDQDGCGPFCGCVVCWDGDYDRINER